MKRIFVISLVALALVASAVWAQGPGQRFDRGDGMGYMRFAEELKLTDQQKDQMEKLQTDFHLQMVDRRASLEKARIELHSLMRNDGPETEVLVKIDQVSKLRGDMQKARYQQHNQMKGLLTKEQQAQFEQLRDDRREMRKGKGRGMLREKGCMDPEMMDGRGPQGGHGF